MYMDPMGKGLVHIAQGFSPSTSRWLMTTILDVECERSGGAKTFMTGRETLFVYTTCGTLR